MPSKHSAPFDRLKLSHTLPCLRFVISTDASVIMNTSDEILSKIIQCNRFEEVSILFTPTNNDAVIQRLKVLNGQPASISIKGAEIYLDGLFLCNYNSTSDLYQYNKDYGARQIDIICYIYTKDYLKFDYFVTSSQAKEKLREKDNVITIDDVLEYIRLYFLQQESFYVTPNFSIEETGYYMYRPRKIFNEYQRLWEYALAMGGTASLLVEWSCSLINRLEFFCRSIDILKIESLRNANNTVNGRIRYHLFVLILCITSIFDNMAWIIHTYFSLGIDKRKVSLHQPQSDKDPLDNQRYNFVKVLSSKSPEIANYLCETRVKEFIRLIYPLRDEFMHREAPESSTLLNSHSRSTSLIQLSTNAFKRFLRLDEVGVPCKQCVFQLDVCNYIKIYPFALFMEKHLAEIVNAILRLLPFTNRKEKLKSLFEDIDQCTLFI